MRAERCVPQALEWQPPRAFRPPQVESRPGNARGTRREAVVLRRLRMAGRTPLNRSADPAEAGLRAYSPIARATDRRTANVSETQSTSARAFPSARLVYRNRSNPQSARRGPFGKIEAAPAPV